MGENRMRWARRVVLAVVVLGGLLVGGTVVLLRRPPAAWHEAQRLLAETSEDQRAQIAAQVLERLDGLVGAEPGDDVHVDATVTMRLTNVELVAFATDMFDEWVAQRGYEVPGPVTRPAVLAHDKQLILCFAVSTTNWRQVFTGPVEVAFRPDGMAEGRVRELNAGSLPVSVVGVGEMLRDHLPSGQDDKARRLGEWLEQLHGFEFRPVLELDYRRRARVVAMVVGDDSVTVTFRVQDHRTYRRHNALMDAGGVAVTDELPATQTRGAVADVPASTE